MGWFTFENLCYFENCVTLKICVTLKTALLWKTVLLWKFVTLKNYVTLKLWRWGALLWKLCYFENFCIGVRYFLKISYLRKNIRVTMRTALLWRTVFLMKTVRKKFCVGVRYCKNFVLLWKLRFFEKCFLKTVFFETMLLLKMLGWGALLGKICVTVRNLT